MSEQKQKLTVAQIQDKKGNEKLSMVTCYDYSFAGILDRRVDIILVGDSMGHVILGFEKTAHVRMEDILRHLGAVRRGAPDTFVVGDLVAGSYENADQAIRHAETLLEEGADAVKPEGKPEIVAELVKADIPVMAHLGYLPQTAERFTVVGRSRDEADLLLQQSKTMEQAGAFSLILECVPSSLAGKITRQLNIPTIGIGSGVECDGQVLVLYDLLGLFTKFKPKFVRRYLNLSFLVGKAVDQYVQDIKNKSFPAQEEEYT